ncbi:MAG: L-rhamnose mutarotase [Aquiluna sp.]|nr:L-rhamnose mutarotase [Aquiluna sp.]
MQRYASVINLKKEGAAEYQELHANAWPDVLAKISQCNIRNYSIYRYEDLLFSYFEYVGSDYEGDMARMAQDEVTQEWWSVCKPLMTPVLEAGKKEWWHEIQEIFHLD